MESPANRPGFFVPFGHPVERQAQHGTIKLSNLAPPLTLVAVKHFLPTLTLLALAGASLAAPPRPAASVAAAPARPTATLYVCMSKTSYAYHSSEGCSGLNRCAHPLKAMPTAEAQKLGKRACHRCY